MSCATGTASAPRCSQPTPVFADAAKIYLAKIAERRAGSTYDIYRYWMDAVVRPALGELQIHECDAARLDAYFTDLQRRGYAANTRRTLRAIVRDNAAGSTSQSRAEQSGPRAGADRGTQGQAQGTAAGG